jgi:hypothetical protein
MEGKLKGVGKVIFQKTFAVRQYKTHDKGTCSASVTKRRTENNPYLSRVVQRRTARLTVVSHFLSVGPGALKKYIVVCR